MPRTSFRTLLSNVSYPQEEAKLLCILNYFDRVCNVKEINGEVTVATCVPKGNITVHRQVLYDYPDFSKSKKKISKMVC